MTAGYIGILKQGDKFRSYWREGERGAWKQIQLEGEMETSWSDDSFKDILRNLQIDADTSALGILVISDKEESIDFPEVKEPLPFSYEELRDFCQSHAEAAAHWIYQGQPLDEALCQEAGFPMDEAGGDRYILSSGELTGSLEELQAPEIPEEDTAEEAAPQEEEAPQEEMPQEAEPSPVPMTEKQRRHDAYLREICNGERDNPLKDWY